MEFLFIEHFIQVSIIDPNKILVLVLKGVAVGLILQVDPTLVGVDDIGFGGFLMVDLL